MNLVDAVRRHIKVHVLGVLGSGSGQKMNDGAKMLPNSFFW